MNRTLIENGIVWKNGFFITDHIIVVEDGKIAAILPRSNLASDVTATRISADNNYVLPGFVDVHIHGSNNCDTMDATEDALQGFCDFLVTQGVTSVLPTTMSDTNEHITRALSAMTRFAQRQYTPYIGTHLEGPYLNPEHRGSQPDTHLRPPQRLEYLKWFETGQVKLITIAPELVGGDQLIHDAQDYGITVALGHSGATYEFTHHAFDIGLRQITHTFNGVVGIHHRHPGALVAAFENPAVTLQVIPDGVHVHPAIINMILKLVGTERVIVITDAMRAAGLADGHYQLGDVAVTVKHGEARTEGGGLAGSTLTMPNGLRNMMHFCGLTLAEVVPMLTRVPAKSIGMYPQKGSMQVGADADFVFWNEERGVQATLIAGVAVYQQAVVT